MSISVLILAKNEEKYIGDCIRSASFADEIIVIDDYSMDGTADIAKELGARVYQNALVGWGAQQNFALEKAQSDWIFFLDADERITSELANEIADKVMLDKQVAYKAPRLNHAMGKELWHGGWYPDYVLRLMPKDGVVVEGLVHPYFVHKYTEKKMKNPIIHYTYHTWEQYFNKLNLYTSLAAKKNIEKGKTAYFLRDIILRPWFAFIKMYFIQAGFLDGGKGFVLAVFHFFYTMAKYVKMYDLQKNGVIEDEKS